MNLMMPYKNAYKRSSERLLKKNRVQGAEFYLKGLVLCFLLSLSFCRTVKDPSRLEEANKQPKTDPKAHGFLNVLELTTQEGRGLYLEMLDAASGAKLEKDISRRESAVIACKKSPALASCVLQIAGGIGQESPPRIERILNRELSEKLRLWIIQSRPELSIEPWVYSDVQCDYIGTKSPPFSLEDVRCSASHPRSFPELFFSSAISEELSDLLRLESSYGTGILALEGTLVCEIVSGSQRRVCVVRGNKSGFGEHPFRVVTAQNSAKISDLMLKKTAEILEIEAKDRKEAVSEMIARLWCVVDSRLAAEDGRRYFHCYAKI